MVDTLTLCVGIPAYRRLIDVDQWAAAANFGCAMLLSTHEQRVQERGCNFQWRGFLNIDSCSVDHARNMMIHLAQKHEADWLLMMDADTVQYEPDPMLDMIAHGHKKGAAVIAAPVKRRGSVGRKTEWSLPTEFDDKVSYNVVVTDEQREAFGKDRLGEVQSIGTACMAVNLRWLSQCWPAWPWFATQQCEGGETPHKIGEDYAFCEGVRNRGGTIIADGRFEPFHVGAQ